MDPIEVTATATVMIASKPGGKPTPHVITAAYADELITALCAAKTACIAGQAALDAANEALAGRDDGDVVEATIYCGAVAPHSGVPCSLPEHGREVRHEHQREGRPAIVWDADTWTSADPAGDGGELPLVVDGMRRMMCRLCRVRPADHMWTVECPGNPHARPAPGHDDPCACGWTGPGRDSEAHRREHDAALGDPGPADPDDLCDCTHPAGGHVAGYGRCLATGCGCNHVMITVIHATPAAVLAESIATGKPVTVAGDAGAVACARPECGHPERVHIADDEQSADGPCMETGCQCLEYTAPADEPLPVSYLPLRRGARIAGGAS